MRERPLILIIDDERDSADNTAANLKSKHTNWEILVAYSLDEGLMYIKQRELDALVTDYKLDTGDKAKTGLVAVEAAKKRDPLCVAILITGYPDEFDRYRDAYAKGLDDCIHKAQRGISVPKEVDLKLCLSLEKRWLHLEAYYYARHIDPNLRSSLGSRSKSSRLSRRFVSVLFADIRNFTKVTGQLRSYPNLIVRFLEDYYSICNKIADQNGGVVDKFMGDGAMMIFGLFDQGSEERQNRSARSCVEAALALKNEVSELLAEFRKECGKWYTGKVSMLQMGIGINAGDVAAGIVHTEQRDQFTAVGHVVNLAQKFESSAGKKIDGHLYSDILVSSPVYLRCEETFDFKQEKALVGFGENQQNVWGLLGKH